MGVKIVRKLIKAKYEELRNNKRKARVISILILLVIVLIFVYSAWKFSTLEKEIMRSVATYGFIALFVSSFILDFLMQPLGPDIPLVAGILAGLNPVKALIAIAIASYLASFSSYFLGRIYGTYGLKKLYGSGKYRKWRRTYSKYGRVVLTIGALTPVPYVPMCWMSGIFKMKLWEFILFALVTRTLRFVGVAYLTLLLKGV